MTRSGSGAGPVRVVVVGAGFAGFHAVRALHRLLPTGTAEITLISPQDYLLYSPLLPEVATGLVDPRHLAVSLRQALPGTRLFLGRATRVDRGAGTRPRPFSRVGWPAATVPPARGNAPPQ